MYTGRFRKPRKLAISWAYLGIYHNRKIPRRERVHLFYSLQNNLNNKKINSEEVVRNLATFFEDKPLSFYHGLRYDIISKSMVSTKKEFKKLQNVFYNDSYKMTGSTLLINTFISRKYVLFNLIFNRARTFAIPQ